MPNANTPILPKYQSVYWHIPYSHSWMPLGSNFTLLYIFLLRVTLTALLYSIRTLLHLHTPISSYQTVISLPTGHIGHTGPPPISSVLCIRFLILHASPFLLLPLFLFGPGVGQNLTTCLLNQSWPVQFISFFMGSLLLISSPFRGLSFTNFANTDDTWVNCSSFSLFKFRCPRRLGKSPVAVNCLSPPNPNSSWATFPAPIKPFSCLIPLFRKVKDLAVKSSNQKWVSVFQDFSVRETQLLQNGAFGTALMSVTATAKVKISPFMATLAANPTFLSGLCAWLVAQSMKVFLNFCVERKWDFRFMFASGGMPSSHSALCTALTTSVAICHGIADSLFPVSLGFSLIVMYDAIGVRRHAGMQAEVLNLIVEDLFQGHPISQRKLKELLGHTPSQVFGGALLGILVAWACCHVCQFPV